MKYYRLVSTYSEHVIITLQGFNYYSLSVVELRGLFGTKTQIGFWRAVWANYLFFSGFYDFH